MKKLITILILCFGCLQTSTVLTAQKAASALKVVIIRHGEKPADGDNLSCEGLNRALQLPNVLHAKFGVPAYTYVPTPNFGKSTSRARMYQTIIPFAAKYNLNINTKYDEDDAKGIAETVLTKTGTVLLVWEHKRIPNVARAMGVKDKDLSWDDKDYDSIWIVTFANGKATLSKDKEHIVPGRNVSSGLSVYIFY